MQYKLRDKGEQIYIYIRGEEMCPNGVERPFGSLGPFEEKGKERKRNANLNVINAA